MKKLIIKIKEVIEHFMLQHCLENHKLFPIEASRYRHGIGNVFTTYLYLKWCGKCRYFHAFAGNDYLESAR